MSSHHEQTWSPTMEDFLGTVLPRLADAGGFGEVTPQIFLSSPNVVELKIKSFQTYDKKIFSP